jgi:hypothetical protein
MCRSIDRSCACQNSFTMLPAAEAGRCRTHWKRTRCCNWTWKAISPVRLASRLFGLAHTVTVTTIPIASERWGIEAHYLAARAEALLVQAPPGAMWYVNAALLEKALQAGFDWIAFLHENGCRVAAWTLDADQPDHLNRAAVLIKAGLDAITTNMPEELKQQLAGAARANRVDPEPSPG